MLVCDVTDAINFNKRFNFREQPHFILSSTSIVLPNQDMSGLWDTVMLLNQKKKQMFLVGSFINYFLQYVGEISSKIIICIYINTMK